MTCVWEPDLDTCASGDWDDLDPEVQARALLLATSSLQALTYYRVGTCPVTIRPCPQASPGCGCGFTPHLGEDGLWYNACSHRTRCSVTSEIDLPGPVGYISEFKINGSAVDLESGDWRLDDGHLLVWQGDGDSPIPSGQDLNKPDSEQGTYSITYSRSYPVLEDGRIAVAYLALEFAKACKPKGKCSLPRGVTNVVRNGVSFSIEAGLFPNGLTTIDQVDQYILKWAPAGSPTKTAVVFDPAKRSPRRTSTVPLKGSVGSF
jgi:hypothetical protein